MKAKLWTFAAIVLLSAVNSSFAKVNLWPVPDGEPVSQYWSVEINGQKVGEIKFNADGQQILLPKQLIKQNAGNEITIKTGKNLFQKAYVDYDDIEVANLHLEFKPALANDY